MWHGSPRRNRSDIARPRRRGHRMIERRMFITLLGGAVAWPLATHAQQPALPVIGWLRPIPPTVAPETLNAFRQGLGEIGYAEGRNVLIEHRWSSGNYEQLAALAAELVERRDCAPCSSRLNITKCFPTYLVGTDSRLAVLAHRGELQGEDTPDPTARVSGMRRSAVSSCPARAEWWHLAQRPDCQ